MKKPPLTVVALPTMLALGIWLGARAAARPVEMVSLASADSAGRSEVRVAPDSSPAPLMAGANEEVLPLVEEDVGAEPQPGELGPDGGGYEALVGGEVADTLPAAPSRVVDQGVGGGEADPEAGSDRGAAVPAALPPPPPPPPPSPAQDMSFGAAVSQPLVASIQGRGRVTFLAAWNAPAARAGLAGEWAPVVACSRGLRLSFEQASPGVGGMRGVGEAPDPDGPAVALVVPRQHCRRAASRWSGAGSPRAADVEATEESLGERAHTAKAAGGRILIATDGYAAALDASSGALVWSEAAPEGSRVRLLGTWDGRGVWVAIRGDRIVRVWVG